MTDTAGQRSTIPRVIWVSNSDTKTGVRYGPTKGDQPLGRHLPTEKTTNAKKKKTGNARLKVKMRCVRVTNVATAKTLQVPYLLA